MERPEKVLGEALITYDDAPKVLQRGNESFDGRLRHEQRFETSGAEGPVNATAFSAPLDRRIPALLGK